MNLTKNRCMLRFNRRVSWRWVTLILCLTVFFLVSGIHNESYGRQIRDMTGRPVTLPEEIRRIYSPSPPATYMVYAVDPERIVGLNFPFRPDVKHHLHPRVAHLPVVGGWFGQGQTLNLETLLTIRPDMILVWQWKQSAVNDKIEKTLIPLGFPVVYIQVDTLRDYPTVFRFIGTLLHREERSRELAAYAEKTLHDLDTLHDRLPDSERLSVYYAQDPDGLRTDCDQSIHAELISLCGAQNVHRCSPSSDKNGFGMEKISIEQVLRYNPQVILARNPRFYDRVYQDPRWQSVKAVQSRQVHLIPRIPFDWFDRPPSFMRLLGARWLMNRLYPAYYPVDMVEETRRFYRLFLGISLDEQEVLALLYPREASPKDSISLSLIVKENDRNGGGGVDQ